MIGDHFQLIEEAGGVFIGGSGKVRDALVDAQGSFGLGCDGAYALVGGGVVV